MSSSKNLFEAECSQPNALVRVGRQMFQDASAGRARNLLGPVQPPSRPEDEFTQEYLAQFGNANRRQPMTFSMHGLLEEVNRVDSGMPSSAMAANWSREYMAALPPAGLHSNNMIGRSDWANEYMRQQENAIAAAGPEIFDDPWHRASVQPQELKWSAEYLADAESGAAQLTAPTASSILDGVSHDAQLWNSEFTQFMQKVDRGDIKIHGDRAVETTVTEKEVAEGGQNYWDALEAEWDHLAKTSEAHNWLNEYDSFTLYKNYDMAEQNPYINSDDPLTLGKGFMSKGDLANAVLCFEAAVHKQSDSSEAWLHLSRAQAENEQEARAIAAANKCLELKPNDLDALAVLSTAYANESLYDSSCKALANWLAAHPKYKDFAPSDVVNIGRKPVVSSFMDQSVFSSVERAFLDAARSDSSVDADLQNCLGVLYNLTGDTSRAVDCFQTALMVRPEDARFWNRLGATLANGGRSAEAVAAYRKALELYPGFVRARYNLGISCLNLAASREAIDHFLSALSLQMRGVGPTDQRMMSDGIWSTLRVAVMQFQRDDWVTLVDNRDFNALKNAFSPSTGDSAPSGIDHVPEQFAS